MSTSNQGQPRLRLRLTGAAEAAVRSGHPWVYSDKIRERNRPGHQGELAVLYDRQDRFLALGLYDPDSPIAVRILHRGAPVQLHPGWWLQRLSESLSRRAPLFDAGTTGYRLINGESDGFPGLVLDRYGICLVLKLYTPAWLPALTDTGASNLGGLRLPQLIQSALAADRLVLRLSRNIATAAALAGFTDGQNLFGTDSSGSVVFEESGLQFESDVVRGQKTGFFLDQRDNRIRVGQLVSGADVLNIFSFSGGFSVHAAHGGARSVTDLDISPHALEAARRNFRLNQHRPGLSHARHHQVQADAFDWLARTTDSTYDFVILDPPSLAKRESERPGAIAAYARLARLAINRVRPGGWLLAASCSAHVTAEEFFGATRSSLNASSRPWKEVHTTGHAPDHPATFPEAQYLKALYARLGAV